MKTNEEKAVEKKKCRKSTKLVAFALSGLAIGAVAYYLFGTKEGRKTLNKAASSVSDIRKSLKAQAEEGLHKANQLANKAKEEYNRVINLAQDAGADVLEKAKKYKEEGKSVTKEGLKYAEELANSAKKKVDKA